MARTHFRWLHIISTLITTAALIALVALISSCSSTTNTDSQAGIDPHSVPEPVPKREAPSRYGNPPHYEVFGRRYWVRNTSAGYRQRGRASWYGPKFHGKRTSSGTTYNMYEVTAAHKSLPIPTYARVTRLDNGRSIVVKINDRGPFVDDRIIDLSYVAAAKLGMIKTGTAAVEVVALQPYQTLARASQAPAAAYTIPQKSVPASTPKPANFSEAILVKTKGSTDRLAGQSAPAAFDNIAYVQIGAFSLRQSAEKLQTQLSRQLNYAVVLDSRSADLYKVRVGPVRNRPELNALQQRLADLGFYETSLVFE